MSDLSHSKATKYIKTLVDSTIVLDRFYPEFQLFFWTRFLLQEFLS